MGKKRRRRVRGEFEEKRESEVEKEKIAVPKAVTFFPFLMSCTRTHFRMAELGCLASTPTFSRTIPLAWEEPPKGEDLKAVPRARFLYPKSAHRWSRRLLRSLRAALRPRGCPLPMVARGGKPEQSVGGLQLKSLDGSSRTSIKVYRKYPVRPMQKLEGRGRDNFSHTDVEIWRSLRWVEIKVVGGLES